MYGHLYITNLYQCDLYHHNLCIVEDDEQNGEVSSSIFGAAPQMFAQRANRELMGVTGKA